MTEGMLTYRIHWEKGEKTGDFLSHGLTDEDCIKGGHKEVEEFGGIVTDYYQVSPSTKKLVAGLQRALDRGKARQLEEQK